MKKQILAESAANLYIEKFMTLENIAKQLNVSERTLSRWKAEGNWEEKRFKHIQAKTTFHEDLCDFGKTLLESIKADMENGEKIEPSRTYTLTKIMNMLKNVKTYDDKVTAENCETEKPKFVGLSDDIVREIEEKILGITYDE